METKHLSYLEGWSDTGKTKKVVVSSSFDKTILGTISWSGRWRQYVFCPTISLETQWSTDCLFDLTFYIKGLNAEQRRKK